MSKTAKQLERYFKGAANHYRIAILMIVAKRPGICLREICYEFHANPQHISAHTTKLVNSGLLRKRYRGREISHSLSPYGEKFLKFIKSF